MSDEWYFAWDEREFGPFSADQMKTLAAIGRLQPTDSVWTPAMTCRVTAGRIKNLFGAANGHVVREEVHATPEPAIPPTVAEAEPPVEAQEPPAAEPPAAQPPAAVAPAVKPPPPTAPVKKKGKATAGPGAVIVSQDGERVQFKKKCVKCGFEDPTRHSLAIRNGTIRSPLFCPKCHKTQSVELNCRTH